MNHPFNDLIPKSKLRLLPTKTHQLRTMTDNAYKLAGLTDTEIRRIRAAFRLACDSLSEPEKITSASALAEFVLAEMPELLSAQQEYFVVLALDTQAQPIGLPIVSTIGTLRSCMVHPRETFREAIARSANSIVSVHNHPSGDLQPSAADLDVFSRLDQAGDILGIPCTDHLIVSRRGWFSQRTTIGSLGNGIQLFG
jgi:DNA repair protein RadC